LGNALLWILAILALLVALLAALLGWGMWRSRPIAEGAVVAAGLSAPVTIARDADGVPTLTGSSRADLAYALGFLHGQERTFQMDTLRRLAAGELSELSGSATEAIDRRIRVHRFRARAQAIVAAMSPAERALLDRYVAGVNAGRGALAGSPFEYLVARATPEPWVPEDTVLAVFAMYLNLQPAVPQREMDRAIAEKAGGRALADFLFPVGGPLDAPLDGSVLPEPPMPGAAPAAVPAATPDADVRIPEMAGSNNWAVGGALTASGAALVANDMHLGLGVPAIWYRARLILRPATGSAEAALDLNGVTLPGTPFLVAGSNGRIAWGFTNSYIDTADAVIVEWVDEKSGTYRVPGGTATVRTTQESLCIRSDCTDLPVRDTIWGPIVGTDALGRTIAMRWTAHDPAAVRLEAALALEQAGSVDQAIAVAHRSAIPQQNLMVGDAAGNIAWTIIGRVPKRVGFFGQDAVSFADGTRRWDGDLAPAETPVVRNPAEARLWTANTRVMGGEALQKLGDGGGDNGSRASRIRDRLRAQDRFAPADFLAIQLDDVALRNRWWQTLLLAELEQRRTDPKLAALIPPVRAWGERALPRSAGYRMVDVFRRTVVEDVFASLMGKPEEGGFRKSYASGQSEGAVRRLLEARPPGLLPDDRSWTAVMEDALDRLAADVAEAGGPERFTWGAVGLAGVKHPLTRAVAPLGWIVNPRDQAVPGDRPTVRAQAPGFGASQRFAVSPGREAEGLFHMPGGNAGNPLARWYLAGHQDWVEGRSTPFLPGPARWTLVLQPAG
jgi:penicillin amidase